MKDNKARWVSKAVLATGVALTTALVGCTGSTGGSPGPAGGAAAGATVPTPPPDKCGIVEGLRPPAGAARFEVVLDLTRSGQPLGEPPALTQQILAAQRAGQVMQVVGVNGPGAAPVLLDPIVLDPMPGNQSEDAQQARAVAAGCAVQAASSPARARPTAPGSDPLRAVITALKQRPKRLLVVSDGVPTGGPVGLDRLGWDVPVDQLVHATQALYPVPAAPGVTATWANLGRTRTVLPEWAPARLQRIWAALLRGKVNLVFDPVVGATRTSDRTAPELPADTVPVPTIRLPKKAGPAGCLTIPAAVLFQPDSASMTHTAALKTVAATLRQGLRDHPDYVVLVSGHTAHYGTTAGRARLSTQRAAAVAAALRAAGITNRITSHGYGSTRPAAPELRPDGTHDLAAAAANRRVSIAYGPATATRTTAC